MLVLSRQRDETIMIGDDIEITVVDIRGDKVRLGITAPNTIPVHRKEVYEAIQRENREAAKVRMEDLPILPPRLQGAGRSSAVTGDGAAKPSTPGSARPAIPVSRTLPLQGERGASSEPPAGKGQPKPPISPGGPAGEVGSKS